MDVRAVTDLARMKASTIVGMTVILGIVIVLKEIPTLTQIVFGFGVGFVLSASTNTINDIMDLELDQFEKPERPLPRGDITMNQAWLFFGLETIIAFFFGIMLSVPAFLLTSFVALISVLYSLRLKNSLIFKNTLTAFGVASAFLVGVLATSKEIPVAVILFFLQIFITVVAFEIHKDIADTEGDAERGKITIPTRFGKDIAAIIAVVLYLGAFLLFQGILINSTSTIIIFLWIVDIIGTICGLFFLFPILKNQDAIIIHRSRKRIMALLGIFVITTISSFLG
ncbi:MAG: UbiA family prenyltransferase [Candidatus Hodarchaeota archaeon]